MRAALDAFNRRDKDAFLEACHPSIRNVPPREWPEFVITHGPEAVWDFFVANNDTWEESPLGYAEIVDAGSDTIVGQLHGELRGTASGVAVEWSFWQVVTFRDGKIAHLQWFSDRVEALGAVGRTD